MCVAYPVCSGGKLWDQIDTLITTADTQIDDLDDLLSLDEADDTPRSKIDEVSIRSLCLMLTRAR